jgi:uncharacterized protein YdbL (DUF1318 family)
MCKKSLPSPTPQCPRCRADLSLLVAFMSNLDEHLLKAEAAMKAGELGEAVWAYMNVLETDPEHPVAVRQVRQVATAVRQFDEARRTSHRTMFLFGIGAVLALFVLLGSMFGAGFWIGKHFSGLRSISTQEAK